MQRRVTRHVVAVVVHVEFLEQSAVRRADLREPLPKRLEPFFAIPDLAAAGLKSIARVIDWQCDVADAPARPGQSQSILAVSEVWKPTWPHRRDRTLVASSVAPADGIVHSDRSFADAGQLIDSTL